MTAQFFFRKEKEGRKREKLTLGSSEYGPNPGKPADWKGQHPPGIKQLKHDSASLLTQPSQDCINPEFPES